MKARTKASLTGQRNQSSSQTFYYPFLLYELRQTEMIESLFKAERNTIELFISIGSVTQYMHYK